MSLRNLLTLGLLTAALSGCTWVKLTEQGEAVSVAASVPATCEKLGSTSSMVKSDIASFDRNSAKVATELETLARNAAATMGGDTIVPETEVSEQGERRFGIYRCAS